MSNPFDRLHPPIRQRRSGRAFSPRPVGRETVELLLEAARWAESCFNFQPWRFVVATEEGARSRLHGALKGGNAWAKGAPVLVAVASRQDLDKVGSEGRDYFLFDTGLGTQNLVIQAASMGLTCHLMAGFDPAAAREALGIPEDFVVIALMAVGHPGDPDGLEDEELRRRESVPRQRKPVEEIASFERWDPRLEPAEDA